MEKRINLFLIIAIVLLIIPIYSYFKHTDTKTILENNYVKTNGNNTLSLMYETSVGSGEYVVSNDTAWPNEEYIFNETKSKCENGGKLTWNENTKTILLKNNISDKCYVYFDKKETLANYIKSTASTDPTLILHNGTIKDTTYGVIDAEDSNYRYSGASEEVNNFVCFGSDATPCPNDNLYRIIGVFGDQVKLIKYDYALTNLLGTDGEYKGMYDIDASYYKGQTDVTTIPGYYFNSANGETSTNEWAISKLNTVNLNTNYINNIGTKWADKIADTIWNIGEMSWDRGVASSNIAKIAYNYELGTNSINKTYLAKIGLIYMSDYYYAADSSYWTYQGYNSSDATRDYRVARDNNWMYMGLYEWSITPRTGDSTFTFRVDSPGFGHDSNVYAYGFGVRPCFYLKSSITILSGLGTLTNPYRIS